MAAVFCFWRTGIRRCEWERTNLRIVFRFLAFFFLIRHFLDNICVKKQVTLFAVYGFIVLNRHFNDCRSRVCLFFLVKNNAWHCFHAGHSLIIRKFLLSKVAAKLTMWQLKGFASVTEWMIRTDGMVLVYGYEFSCNLWSFVNAEQCENIDHAQICLPHTWTLWRCFHNSRNVIQNWCSSKMYWAKYNIIHVQWI